MALPLRTVVYRAKAIVPLAGVAPARGTELCAPLDKIENGQILACNGQIAEIGKKSSLVPPGATIIDFGDRTLIPTVVNAHTHLSLSWLKGKTIWGQGFTAWLQNMVPQIMAIPHDSFANQDSPQTKAIYEAFLQLKNSGCGIIGDIGGSLAGSLSAIDQGASAHAIQISSFCEWIGWPSSINDKTKPWPQRCASEIPQCGNPAPCGHALYSTSPNLMRAAHAWCLRNHKIFAFHLGECPEETEMLVYGAGSLRNFYGGKLLPDNWHPPRMRPLRFAQSLGILSPNTLAAHGVHLDKNEIREFSSTGAALCFCPRSNRNLGVGLPLFKEWLASGALLCLGTDGLVSNTDLDPRNDAVFLRKTADLPPEALIRMLTVNGASALGHKYPALQPGNAANFSFLPEELAI